jgi:hypothetical protein
MKMKKKVFGGIAVLVIAAIAAFNVNFNSQSNELSAISLANVEALAIEISSPGQWVAHTLEGEHSWRCDSGGRVCCPDFLTESC